MAAPQLRHCVSPQPGDTPTALSDLVPIPPVPSLQLACGTAHTPQGNVTPVLRDLFSLPWPQLTGTKSPWPHTEGGRQPTWDSEQFFLMLSERPVEWHMASEQS